MARIFTDGAETGDNSFWDVGWTYNLSTNARSGNYAYQGIFGGQMIRSLPSGLGEFYFRIAFRPRHSFTTGPLNRIAFTAGDWVNQHIVGLRWDNGTTKVRLGGNEWGTGGTQYDTDNFQMLINTYYLLEMYVKIDDTNGRVVLKRDGVVIFDYTGNTVFHGASAPSFLRLKNDAGDHDVDDLALNDTTGDEDNSWCGDGRVIPLVPNAAGDVTQLQRSGGSDNWQAVNEGMPGNGDTNYVYGNTVGDYDLYHIANPNIPSNSIIRRVWVTGSARTTASSGGKIALGVKSGTTTDWSDDITLGGSYLRYHGKVYTKNPANNQAWTVSDIDNLQIGVKVTELGQA